MKRSAVLAVAAIFALALSGCRFGSAAFAGTLADRTFDPGGTVFAYVDARDAALVQDDDADPPVAIAATWLVFDPRSDLADKDGAELDALAHELRLRDALSLVFAARSDVTIGATFESDLRGEEETGDGAMTAHVHLAPERLDGAKTYADFVPFAGRRVVHVALEEVDFDNLREIAGRVSVAFERTDGDPAEVREGTVTGTFRAPLVEERLAERNLSLLQCEDVLGLPLRAPEVVP